MFGLIEQMAGKLLRTIGQVRANFAMAMIAVCYHLKRLVNFRVGENRVLLGPETYRITVKVTIGRHHQRGRRPPEEL